MQQEGRNKKAVFGMVVLVSFFIRIIHLDLPIGNDMHAFRQTQTAMAVQNYFRDGWSLFHYETPLFGAPWQVLMECPIYQTVVYVFMRVFRPSNIDFGCRAVSLLTFYLSAGMLKKVAGMFVKGDAPIYVCCVYLLAVFNIYWSRAAMIDYMSVLFALIYVWGLYGWLLDGKRSKYCIGLFFGCLGYLLKATTMFPYVYLLMFSIPLLLIREIQQREEKMSICIYSYLQKNRKRLLLLLAICIIPAVVGGLWTSYADYIKSRSEYTAWLSSANLSSWNYGTFAQKCDISQWQAITERLYGFFGGSIIFCILLAGGGIAIFRKREISALVFSFLSCILTIFTLFNLYYVHDYYLMAVSPLVCMFIGILLAGIKDSVWQEGNTGKICFGILCAAMLCLQIEYNQPYMDGMIQGNKETSALAGYIRQVTKEDELVVIEGEDWSPVTLYYAQRKGFMVKMAEWLSDSRLFAFLQKDHYTTLAAHSLDTAGIFAQYYDVVVQYPGSPDGYVYKFYNGVEAQEIVSRSRTYDLQADCGTDMALGWDADYMQIHYEDTGISRQVAVEVTDRQGNVIAGKINLPAGCREIYYKISELCDAPVKARILAGEETVP
ncbi:MAG: hypothetical protein K2N87_09560 [Eubacterium sp.]|nr:hypothetical protein [Eubacterium sp.]